MSNKMLLTAKLDQKLIMSQQLRQAISLLQYTTLDLKQLVANQLVENPLLEIEEDHEAAAADNEFTTYSAASTIRNKVLRIEEENPWENIAQPQALRDHLLAQTLLCQFNETEQLIAEAIIDALDDAGRLTMSLAEIAALLNIEDEQQLEVVLQKLQTFDPLGVAARSLHECLLIQHRADPQQDHAWRCAGRLLREEADLLNLPQTKKMLKKHQLSLADYQAAINKLRSYHFSPGLNYATHHLQWQEPELLVKKNQGIWQVFLAESLLTKVSVNSYYAHLLKQNRQQQSFASLQKELQEAQWLLKGLQRRNETLIKVAKFIVEKQAAFFDHGKSAMQAMKINDAAIALGLHESTISRVTTGKYIATPHGVYELKYFFPSHVMMQSGASCSATAVKAIIQSLIEHEKHAYSDEELAGLLRAQGINIARRTVAKYREALNIAPSYLRAQRYQLLVEA